MVALPLPFVCGVPTLPAEACTVVVDDECDGHAQHDARQREADVAPQHPGTEQQIFGSLQMGGREEVRGQWHERWQNCTTSLSRAPPLPCPPDTHNGCARADEAAKDDGAGERAACQQRIAVDDVALDRDNGHADAEAEEDDACIGKDPVHAVVRHEPVQQQPQRRQPHAVQKGKELVLGLAHAVVASRQPAILTR